MLPLNTYVRLDADSGFTGTVAGFTAVTEDGDITIFYVILLDPHCQGYLTPEGCETFVRYLLAHPDSVTSVIP